MYKNLTQKIDKNKVSGQQRAHRTRILNELAATCECVCVCVFAELVHFITSNREEKEKDFERKRYEAECERVKKAHTQFLLLHFVWFLCCLCELEQKRERARI